MKYLILALLLAVPASAQKLDKQSKEIITSLTVLGCMSGYQRALLDQNKEPSEADGSKALEYCAKLADFITEGK